MLADSQLFPPSSRSSSPEIDWVEFMKNLMRGAPDAAADDDDESLHRGLVLESLEYGDVESNTWVDVFPVIWRKASANESGAADVGADAAGSQVNRNACFVFVPSDDDQRLLFFGVPDPAPGKVKMLRANGGEFFFPAEKLSMAKEGGGTLDLASYYVFVDLRDLEAPVLGVLHMGLVENDLTVRRDRLMRQPVTGEVPEQLLLLTMLRQLGADDPALRVIELGGNVGRASVTLSSLLASARPESVHVVFESDSTTAKTLDLVRCNNHASFHVVAGTLNDASRYSLSQSWWVVTAHEHSVKDEDEKTATIRSMTYAETKEAFFGGQDANVWVVDCEGYFAHVVRVFPEILAPTEMLFLENDFADKQQKDELDARLLEAGLRCVLALPGGRNFSFPCYLNFYEVWVRPESVLWQQVVSKVFDAGTSAGLEQTGVYHFPRAASISDCRTMTTSASASGIGLYLPTDLFPVTEKWLNGDGDGDAPKHAYEILSTPACGRCAQLFEEIVAEFENLSPSLRVCFSVAKRDVVRAFATDRTGALTRLRDNHGFLLFDASTEPERPLFLPVVFYNGTYIGGMVQAYAHLQRTIDEEDAEQEDAEQEDAEQEDS